MKRRFCSLRIDLRATIILIIIAIIIITNINMKLMARILGQFAHIVVLVCMLRSFYNFSVSTNIIEVDLLKSSNQRVTYFAMGKTIAIVGSVVVFVIAAAFFSHLFLLLSSSI